MPGNTPGLASTPKTNIAAVITAINTALASLDGAKTTDLGAKQALYKCLRALELIKDERTQ